MPRHKPNTGEHIDDIISRTACVRHDAQIGQPCFLIYYNNKRGEIGPAICNSRVAMAGFNGKIQPGSLSRRDKDFETKSRR